MDYKNEYLTEQIITYLGNKRKLIGFIDETVDKIIANNEYLKNKNVKDISFIDIFAGSGIVSRYSKLKGFKTYSNDLELYSKLIQDVLIGVNENELNGIFKNSVLNLNLKSTSFYVDNDNYQTILNYLNSLNDVQDSNNLYWSIHYAPKDTNNPNFETERLFYTQENARRLDAIVEQIESNNFTNIEKKIIQASLMYKMTKHINTSGTMKGFHNGWGGQGGAAKERIMEIIKLDKLPLINGNVGEIFNTYAENLFLENEDLEEFDFVYADPPYNSHQYSSNYNHLNTLAKNDRWNPGEVGNRTRAGIRTDHNRSDFCKRTIGEEKTLAEEAFSKFIKNIKCKYIILSYNNEGIIGIEDLMSILSENYKNTISIDLRKYNKYRGGKSTQTSNVVMEYIIIVQKNVEQSIEDFEKVKKTIKLVTQKHLFLDKFINYKGFGGKIDDLNLIENESTYSIFYKDIDILEIDKSTYKVINENIEDVDNEIIEYISQFEVSKKEDLIELYFQDRNVEQIKKLITIFKLKKHEEIRKSFEERLNKMIEEIIEEKRVKKEIEAL